MTIRVESDVFDISKRVKEINSDYYIVFNDNIKKYELHSSMYGRNSHLITLPFSVLDERSIFCINKALNTVNSLDDIDKYNQKIKEKILEKNKEENRYKIEKIYDYSNKKSNIISENKFENKWI